MVGAVKRWYRARVKRRLASRVSVWGSSEGGRVSRDGWLPGHIFMARVVHGQSPYQNKCPILGPIFRFSDFPFCRFRLTRNVNMSMDGI